MRIRTSLIAGLVISLAAAVAPIAAQAQDDGVPYWQQEANYTIKASLDAKNHLARGHRNDSLQEQFPRHARHILSAPLSERLPRQDLPPHPRLPAGNVALPRGAAEIDARMARREGAHDRRRRRAVHRRRDDSHGEFPETASPGGDRDVRALVRGKDHAAPRALGLLGRAVQHGPVVSQDGRLRQERLASRPVPDGRILRRVRNLRRVDHAAGEIRHRRDGRARRGRSRLEEDRAAARRRGERKRQGRRGEDGAVPRGERPRFRLVRLAELHGPGHALQRLPHHELLQSLEPRVGRYDARPGAALDAMARKERRGPIPTRRSASSTARCAAAWSIRCSP